MVAKQLSVPGNRIINTYAAQCLPVNSSVTGNNRFAVQLFQLIN